MNMKIIYLHGFASSPQSIKSQFFKKQLKKLNLEIFTPDLNCNDFTNLTITCQIEIIKNIISKNSKEKYILIGSSMGGYVSLLCANLIHSYPLFKKIQKLILLAPALDFTKRILKKDKNKFLEWKKNGFIDVEHYQWKKTLPLSFQLYKDAVLYEKLNLNRVLPVLIFHGINDETVPYEVSLKYLKNNPESQLILLNSDHSLQNQLGCIWNFTRTFLNI